MRVLTFEQYCAEHGVGKLPDTVEFHRLPGLSGRSRYRAIAEGQRRGTEWALTRRKLTVEYYKLVKAGEIRPPTRQERLEFLASGHPDNERTQAAKRLLAKDILYRKEKE